jgi:hypothetical protein
MGTLNQEPEGLNQEPELLLQRIHSSDGNLSVEPDYEIIHDGKAVGRLASGDLVVWRWSMYGTLGQHQSGIANSPSEAKAIPERMAAPLMSPKTCGL